MPRGTNLIREKWIFSDKRGEDGKIIKFMARWKMLGLYDAQVTLETTRTNVRLVIIRTHPDLY